MSENRNSSLFQKGKDSLRDAVLTMSGKDSDSKLQVVDNVVAFCGMSGGCGTSTLVANCAFEASRRRLNVLVIDCNFIYPIQYNYFGVTKKNGKADLVDVITGTKTIGEGIDSTKRVHVLSAYNRKITDIIRCDEYRVVKNAENMIDKVRKLYDLVILDVPMTVWDTMPNSALYSCSQIYQVWSESIDCIPNYEQLVNNLDILGTESYTKSRAIFNKRTSTYYNMKPFKDNNLELVAVIPFAVDVIKSGLSAEIFCEKGQSSSKLAHTFCAGISVIVDRMLAVGGYRG